MGTQSWELRKNWIEFTQKIEDKNKKTSGFNNIAKRDLRKIKSVARK